MNSLGCKKVEKWHGCIPKSLPECSIKNRVAFLLKQGYSRTIKDIVKIIHPSLDEYSKEFRSKYSYIQRIVAEMRGHSVHFHRRGRYRLVWQNQPITLNWLIDYKKEILLGNNSFLPEWMNVKSFFNILDVSESSNGRKYIGGSNSLCAFEITRAGYVTVYVHDAKGDWEEWLEEQLINHRWPQGLVWHIFQHLEPIHMDEHMTIEGFTWPRHLKGSLIKTPYGFDLKLGDVSHPYALEVEFKTNIQSVLKAIDIKLNHLLQIAGWIQGKDDAHKRWSGLTNS